MLKIKDSVDLNMSKSTIFGCESFIDTEMISIRQSVDKYILDEIYKTSVKINVNVDEVRLEKWLKLCLQLENIEQSDLIDMAIKKRIADLSQENQKLKQRIAELEKQNKELKNNQSKIALEKLYTIENMLIDMHTNEEGFEDISESVSIMVSDMISRLERGVE